LVVELKPRLDTWADVEVVDQSGNPLPNPIVRWSGGEAGCLPEEPVAATPGANVVRTPMGPGHYQFSVEVPGYRIVDREADAKLGGAHFVIVMEPSRVVLEAKRIAIHDTVYFEFNKAVIKPESYGLLTDVANVILAHPEVGRVQVEGHTDNKGNDAYNLKLSQARAESVRAFLMTRGVTGDRLVAVGFGESRPIETNNTEEGRSANRRVEFNLIDQAPDPAINAAGAGSAPAGGGQ
jgi:outer membrane protein OmpA-like peptidoglycan-associated protein